MLSREVVDESCRHQIDIKGFGDGQSFLDGSSVELIGKDHDSESVTFAVYFAVMVEPGGVNVKMKGELPRGRCGWHKAKIAWISDDSGL